VCNYCYYVFQEKDGVSKVDGCFLVVSPSSVLYNWRDEPDTWGHFKVKFYHGNTKEGVLEQAAKKKIDVVLTTYDTLRINLVRIFVFHTGLKGGQR
jgi:SNF2 family DNA or RNA helicase